MRPFVVLVAFLLIALIACTQAPFEETPDPEGTPWNVRVDYNVSVNEESVFQEAAAAWERALAFKCPVAFYYRSGLVGDEVPTRYRHLTVKIDPTIRYDGWTEWHTYHNATSARILLRPMGPEYPGRFEYYDYIIKHEIGHAFGLEHGGDGVMAGHYVVSENDADRVAAIQCP